MKYYHVTEKSDAQSILREGFFGSWGDAGYGIYLFDNLTSAQRYMEKGGWDGKLKNPVILEIDSNEVKRVQPDPAWPNPDDYLSVVWHEMDEDWEELDDDEYPTWKPKMQVKTSSVLRRLASKLKSY